MICTTWMRPFTERNKERYSNATMRIRYSHCTRTSPDGGKKVVYDYQLFRDFFNKNYLGGYPNYLITSLQPKKRNHHVSVFDLMMQIHAQGIDEDRVFRMRSQLTEIINAANQLIQLLRKHNAPVPELKISFKSTHKGTTPLVEVTMDSTMREFHELQGDILKIAISLQEEGVSDETLVTHLLPAILRVFTSLNRFYDRLKGEGYTALITGNFTSTSWMKIFLERKEVAEKKFTKIFGQEQEFAPRKDQTVPKQNEESIPEALRIMFEIAFGTWGDKSSSL